MSRILRLQTLNSNTTPGSTIQPGTGDSTVSAGLCSTASAGLCSTVSAGLCAADAQ